MRCGWITWALVVGLMLTGSVVVAAEDDETILPAQGPRTPPPPATRPALAVPPAPPPQPRPYSRTPPPPRLPQTATPAASSLIAPRDRTLISGLPETRRPELLGDAPPLSLLLDTPSGRVLIPRPRGFKIGDNESPQPQTRTYFTFNQFANLNARVNQRFGNDLRDVNLQRNTFGAEMAFCDDQYSIGLRLPTNTVSARSETFPELNGTHTTVGDLSVIFKWVLCETCDADSDTLLSAGIAVTPPTGASNLFNAPAYGRFRNTTVQPYLGYIWRYEDIYIQGFSAVDVPTNRNDATVWYNDVSVRYFLYWNPNPRAWVTSIAPLVELHLNTPLTHRGTLRSFDPAATSDALNLTLGVDFFFCDRLKWVLGYVAPVVGPKALDYEVLSQLKLLY